MYVDMYVCTYVHMYVNIHKYVHKYMHAITCILRADRFAHDIQLLWLTPNNAVGHLRARNQYIY